MQKIKFSHIYPKLWEQKKAELIAVRIFDAQAVQINKDLIEYDTKYIIEEENEIEEGVYDYYPLPKEGRLIQLIFIGDKDIPFCTLRRHIDRKMEYYLSKIGEIFEIVIEEKK